MQLQWRDVSLGGPPINTSLTSAETTELQRLAKGGEVLEVGTAYGYSTVALAQVADHVTAVDPHLTHGSFGAVHENLASYGVADRVTVVQDYSQNVLPRLHEAGLRYDLVWIDGDHTAEGVEHDVTWALKLLKPGGALACHDYDEATCPGVRMALDKLFGGPGELTDTLAVYRDLGSKVIGGPVKGGQLFMVGTGGPELFIPADSGTTVIPE